MDKSITPRVQFINNFLSRRQKSKYLEIGIRNANTLFKIKATKKVGVDPINQISKKDRLFSYLQSSNRHITYHWTTSDDYFENYELEEPFDFIFVDGLHTYTQSFKDVMNSLNVLKEDGLMMLHDCNPKHPLAANPVSPYSPKFNPQIKDELNHDQSWDGAWNGDVWKTILRLRMEKPELSSMVLDTGHGLGLISKRKGLPQADKLKQSIGNIEELEYDDLNTNRKEWLNLRPSNCFESWVRELN